MHLVHARRRRQTFFFEPLWIEHSACIPSTPVADDGDNSLSFT